MSDDVKDESADAIIVGAGAAGLMAARELVRAGKRVIVLEASDRIGGRIHTIYNSSAGVPVELGAEFIHGDAPETTRLLDEARLATFPVLGKHYRSDRGELTPQGPFWNRMTGVFRHLDPDRKTDRSFQQFLDSHPGGRKLAKARELARAFVQGFDAADTSLISEKSLALQGNPAEGAVEARRIRNGYGSLIEYLERGVRAAIRLNYAVRQVTWSESGVRVADGRGRECRARCLIVTVPLPALQDDSIAFEPEIPTVRKAASQLVMGHVLRVCVTVRECFWEEKIDQLGYLHCPRRAFNVWWSQYPIHAPLLVAWSGGPPSLEFAKSDDLSEVVIGELSRVFSMKKNRAASLVDSIHVHDWNRNPWIRGAYAYAGVGGAYGARMLARSAGSTLFFAGEATDSASGGTVEAAIASGKRAAAKVIRTISSG